MAKGSGYTPLRVTQFVPAALAGTTKAARRRILLAAVPAVRAAVNRATPVDSGRLKANNRVSVDVDAVAVVVRNAARHATPVNDGHRAGRTGYVPGRHFAERGIAAANVRAQKAAARQAKAEGRKRRG